MVFTCKKTTLFWSFSNLKANTQKYDYTYYVYNQKE